MLLLLLNQTFKNKSEAEKSNQRFFEGTLLLILLSILTWIWTKIAANDKL